MAAGAQIGEGIEAIGMVLDDVEWVEDNLPPAEAGAVAAADREILTLDVDGYDRPRMVDDGGNDASDAFAGPGAGDDHVMAGAPSLPGVGLVAEEF